MDTTKVEEAGEKWGWGAFGLVAVSILVVVAPLLGGTGGAAQKWICYLAGLDLFCVASGVGDHENDEIESDPVQGS